MATPTAQSNLIAQMQQIYGLQSQGLGQSYALNSGLVQALEQDEKERERQKEKAKEAVQTLATKIIQLSDVPAVKIKARIPDHVGTLTNWRGWRVNDGKLYALGMTGVWEPKKAEPAKCSHNQHHAPDKNCTCGYWTFKTLELLQEALASYAGSVKVLGTVEHWGKVIECTNGFRSEFAYPKELWLLDEDLEHLSWTYGVPVRKL